jgi:acyl dehydratase
VRLEDVNVGDELPSLAREVTREDVRTYAEVSGDHNPLHQDDEVARRAGFPGIVAHGMFTLGHLASCVVSWAGDPAAVTRLRASFRSPVAMGDTIVAGGRVRELDREARTALLDLWVTVERDGVTEHPVKKGEAEVRLES